MSNILIDADILKKSSEQKDILRKTTHNILRSLMDDILLAKQSYKTSVLTTLPITFNIPGMLNKDAQRILWYNLIRELNKKNYRVKINPSKDKCSILIIWISKEEESIISEQMMLIASHVDKSISS